MERSPNHSQSTADEDPLMWHWDSPDTAPLYSRCLDLNLALSLDYVIPGWNHKPLLLPQPSCGHFQGNGQITLSHNGGIIATLSSFSPMASDQVKVDVFCWVTSDQPAFTISFWTLLPSNPSLHWALNISDTLLIQWCCTCTFFWEDPELRCPSFLFMSYSNRALSWPTFRSVDRSFTLYSADFSP